MKLNVRRKRARGFTLVELLAVIAIIGVMIAVLVPSFSGVGRSLKMNSAVMQLRTTLSLARQNAITHRELTYVVFATGNNALYSGTNIANIGMAFRAYNVYGQRSRYLREWIHLPPGVIFVPSQAAYGSTKPRDSKNLFILAGAHMLPFPASDSTPSQLMAIAFKPNGQMLLGNGSGRYEVFLSEGWLDATNTPVGLPVFKPVAQRMLYSVELFGITGRFRINDYSDS